MTKIRDYDNAIRIAKHNGFVLHPCGEYYYKKVNMYKDTYIYISTKDHTVWVERFGSVLSNLDDIVLLPKRMQRYL